MNHDVPYYGRHKVIDLTCPKCQGRLSFLINERHASVYACQCGRWYRLMDWQPPTPAKEKWEYKAKHDLEGRDCENRRDTT